MRILFFGRLADSFGRTLEHDSPSGQTIGELRRHLSLKDPGVRACVGDTMVDDDFLPGPSDTVEFWPPVSGG